MPRKPQAETNHCAVCGNPVDMGKLMCRAHWAMVLRAVQNEVYRTFKAINGAAAGGGQQARVGASRDYYRARHAAIREVRQQLHPTPAAAQPAATTTTTATGAPNDQQAQ